MRFRIATVLLLILVAQLCQPVTKVRADFVKLKNGAIVRGRIQRSAKKPGTADISITTLSGKTVDLIREDIADITRRPLVLEEFESRATQTRSNEADLWNLAEWCREKHLSKQRAELLKRIVKLDPTHEKAHRGLKHVKRNGNWIDRDQERLDLGYVKYKGRYVSPQELKLLEQADARTSVERDWFKKIRLWKIHLIGNNAEKSQTALKELKQIAAPQSVPALVNFFQDVENNNLRQLYVEILGKIPGSRPVKPLVISALHDNSKTIRRISLSGISDDQYSTAQPLFVGQLKSPQVILVRRSAAALETIGDETVVEALIAALNTTHLYKVRVPDDGSSTISMRSNGSFGGSDSVLPPSIEYQLRTGQLPNGVIINRPGYEQRTKVITVRQVHQNLEVLSALKSITGNNFGFDERTWKLWWVTKKDG
jgi:hypothetical protein